ncbi:MAG: pentapeptide repeat-containing protein [Granulosicoccus sp.]
MLANFKNNVVPNVSRLDGNTIDDEERVSFGMVSGTSVDSHIRSVDWTDSIIENCRFNNTTLKNSSFDRVAILDCDLSGVTFSNCLLRECLIMGVNAKYHFALDDCILDHVMFARSRVDRFDIHNTRIVDIEFLGVEASQLDFFNCQAHKRKGSVSFDGCELRKISGLEAMGTHGVNVHVDATMWRDLGDSYLRERGFQQLVERKASESRILDDIANQRD